MSKAVCEVGHAEDFSLDDAAWLGRPVEVDSDQTETLIEKNQHSTMQAIADILEIFKSIKLLVKTKNMSFILWKKKHMDSLVSPVYL